MSRIVRGSNLFRYIWVPILFCGVMLLFYPFLGRFEFDTDEGINLMKAMLVERDYPLYSQVWSDQPPLFTHLLAASFSAFGAQVNTGRLLVLAFSSMLLGSVYAILRASFGSWQALAGALLVVLLPYYTQLSVSVMIGLPAIALAMLALLGIRQWHATRRQRWLVLSALALSGSVLIKLFTVYLAPVFALGLLLVGSRQHSKNWMDRYRALLVWSGLFLAGTLLALLTLVGPQNFGQLVAPHLFSIGTELYEYEYGIEWYLLGVWPYLILAVVGVLSAVWRARRGSMFGQESWTIGYLVCWSVGGFILLKIDHPVWYHHQLLVTIPLAMLGAAGAGMALDTLLDWARSRSRLDEQRLLALAWVIGLVMLLANYMPATADEFALELFPNSPPDELYQRIEPVVTRMNRYAGVSNWAVSDRLMIPFRAGVAAPPELVVMSSKRVNSGNLPQELMVQVIRERQPEVVLFSRFRFPEVEAYLESNYRLIFERGIVKLYLRVDLP